MADNGYMFNKSLVSFNLGKDPNLVIIDALRKQCFSTNETHNTILEKHYDKNGPTCSKTFDGFSCWDKTPANTTVIQKCPDFIVGFDPSRTSFKKCLENGSWYSHPQNKKPWTNYTTCIDYEDLDFRKTINESYVTGYAVSLVVLVVALIIFYFFRTLSCVRTQIHNHLFTALVLNNISWIVWHKTVVEDVTVLQQNAIWCQVLHITNSYFMLSCYLWMFCEGLHLHVALVIVFFKDGLTLRWFCFIGWGLSAIFMAIYVIVRMNLDHGTDRCWMDPSPAFWILAAPVLMTLCLSLVFLINIIRVLLTKMHPTPAAQPIIALKKAARATAILVIYFTIPLFGLHFILIPYRPSPGTTGEKMYQIFSCVMTSFQGLFLATIFCFNNNDVHVAFRTYMARRKRQNEAIRMTGVTGGESVVNVQEHVV